MRSSGPRPSADEVHTLVPTRKSVLGRIVREIGRTTGPDSFDFSTPYVEGVSSEAVGRLIQDAIEETAGGGNVVIVSHAASRALSARPKSSAYS
jgi:hypothetical protein